MLFGKANNKQLEIFSIDFGILLIDIYQISNISIIFTIHKNDCFYLCINNHVRICITESSDNRLLDSFLCYKRLLNKTMCSLRAVIQFPLRDMMILESNLRTGNVIVWARSNFKFWRKGTVKTFQEVEQLLNMMF